MEFLRFGSSIPGSYWGCCAMDIIQNFNFDPDDKASIQIVDGDGGHPMTGSDGGFVFAGPTYRDIFLQRLRIGTFSTDDMPNHGFLAILTSSQVSSKNGKKWLQILKENGFEFIRTVDNSVYSGDSLIAGPGEGCVSAHPNYLFGLFRNIGSGAIVDPFTPPKAWTDLPSVKPEAWQLMTGSDRFGEGLNKEMQEVDLKLYKGLGKANLLTEAEVKAAGAPVIMAGERSKYPQQGKAERDSLKASYAKAKKTDPSPIASKVDPFSTVPA